MMFPEFLTVHVMDIDKRLAVPEVAMLLVLKAKGSHKGGVYQ